MLSQAACGSTFDELKNGLHLNGNQTSIANQFPEYYNLLKNGAGNATFSIVNQVYVQQGYTINKKFQEVAVQQFASNIEPIDFEKRNEAAETINHLIQEKTNNKIKNLIKPDTLTDDTRVVLVSAIYFKGEWEQQFNEQLTKKENFYISETETVQVDFMYMSSRFNYVCLEHLDACALEMKYANSSFSFVAVKPNNRTGLRALETKWNTYNLTTIIKQMANEEIDVWIPKFKVETELNLNDVLQSVSKKWRFV